MKIFNKSKKGRRIEYRTLDGLQKLLDNLKKDAKRIIKHHEKVSQKKEKLFQETWDTNKITDIIEKRELRMIALSLNLIENLEKKKPEILTSINETVKGMPHSSQRYQRYLLLRQEFESLFAFLDIIKKYIDEAINILNEEITTMKRSFQECKDQVYPKEYELADRISRDVYNYIESKFEPPVTGYVIAEEKKVEKKLSRRKSAGIAIALAAVSIMTAFTPLTAIAEQDLRQENALEQGQLFEAGREVIFVKPTPVRDGIGGEILGQATVGVAYQAIGLGITQEGRVVRMHTGRGEGYASLEDAVIFRPAQTQATIDGIQKTSILNIRAFPSADASKVGKLSYGDRVAVSGISFTDANNIWLRVHQGQTTGYIAAVYNGKYFASFPGQEMPAQIKRERNQVQQQNREKDNWPLRLVNHDRLEEFPVDRENLTSGRHVGGANRNINRIILHITQSEGDSAENWFHDPNPPKGAAVSAHYIVHKDGSLIRIVPENRVAYHCSGFNEGSIGIEMVGIVHGDERTLTNAQLSKVVELVLYLKEKYNVPWENIDGHREHSSKSCPGKANLELIESHLRNAMMRRGQQVQAREPLKEAG